MYHKNILPEVKLIDLNVSRSLFAVPKLLRYLIQYRPDVLLSFLTHVNILALIVKFIHRDKIRTVVSERSVISKSLLTYNVFQRIIIRFLMKFFYPHADSIIAISNECANDLSKTINISTSKILVIYNPLIIDTNISKLNSLQELIYSNLVEKKRNGNSLLVGIGRLKKVKNFELLIKAFAVVNKTIPSSLVILGEGPERNTLEKLIQDLNLVGKVHLIGFVDSPSIFLKISDVFVSTSSWEGFGNVILEAMNESLKIVISDCPGGPREILEDGLWGTIVPNNNNEDLLASEILKVIYENNNPKVKDRAMQFDLIKIADEYLKTFKLNHDESI